MCDVHAFLLFPSACVPFAVLHTRVTDRVCHVIRRPVRQVIRGDNLYLHSYAWHRLFRDAAALRVTGTEVPCLRSALRGHKGTLTGTRRKCMCACTVGLDT